MKPDKTEEVKLPPIHMAKIYLHQAQATKWRHWKFWLLKATAKYRLLQLEQIRLSKFVVTPPIQEIQISDHGQLCLF